MSNCRKHRRADSSPLQNFIRTHLRKESCKKRHPPNQARPHVIVHDTT